MCSKSEHSRMRLPLKKQSIALLLVFCSCFTFYCLLSMVKSCKDETLNSFDQSTTNLSESISSEIKVSSSEVAFHAFEKLQPRYVIILTYQRCGSTFFGELFNENTGAFYLFEPLDSLYSAIYGTKEGWNVPSDITNYANGTGRILSESEIHDVSNFLRSLLLCDVDSLPTETLVHRFYRQFKSEHKGIGRYVRCGRRYRDRINRCKAMTPVSLCGTRFGQKSEEVLEDCRRALTDPKYRSNHANRSVFDNYVACMRELRGLIDEHCTPSLKSACSRRDLRAVKLVRGTMASMEPLLESLPNLRIVHLVRDPRAVALSRMHFDSSARGLYTQSNSDETLSREARLYCSTVARDVLKRRELEEKHPGKILSIVYDDVVKDVGSYIEKVYGFLGLPVPGDLWSWYRESSYSIRTGRQTNSTTIATKWQNSITFRENKDIEVICRDFFRLVQFDWAV